MKNGFFSGKGFWNNWCQVHDGFPPISNTTLKACSNCKKNGCQMDVFETTNGAWCGKCLKENPAGKENPAYIEQFELAKSRASIAKLSIVFVEFFFLQSAVLYVFENPLRQGIVSTSLPVYWILLGLVLLAVFAVGLSWLHRNSLFEKKAGEKPHSTNSQFEKKAGENENGAKP